MSETICRWGIMGTADIARKNWKAIRLSGNGRVTAVASRSQSSAVRFIDQCNAEVPLDPKPAPVAGYQALLQRDDVDAVYIPLPTAMRSQWVIAAAEAGKHVLCEKPVALDAAAAAEMVAACQQHGVQFMDGVMFNHSRRLPELRRSLQGDQGCGRLRRITSHFTFSGDADFQQNNIRVHSQLEPHGCLGDLGWYNLRFILWVMDDAMPTTVTARRISELRGRDSQAAVPGEFSAELFFDGGVSASLYCSFLTENQQISIVSGDRGYAVIDDFVLPFYDAEVAWSLHRHTLEIDNCRWNMGRHSERRAVCEYASGEANSQEVNMVRAFARIVLSGQLDPHWPEIALKTQRLLDACVQSAASGGQPVTPSH